MSDCCCKHSCSNCRVRFKVRDWGANINSDYRYRVFYKFGWWESWKEAPLRDLFETMFSVEQALPSIAKRLKATSFTVVFSAKDEREVWEV